MSSDNKKISKGTISKTENNKWLYYFTVTGKDYYKRYRKTKNTKEEAIQAMNQQKEELRQNGFVDSEDIGPVYTQENLQYVKDNILPQSTTIAEAIRKIIEKFGRSISVNYFSERFKIQFGKSPGKFLAKKQKEETVEDLSLQASKAWLKISELKQEYKDNSYKQYNIKNIKSEPTRKILAISDLHIPFERDDLIKDIIEEHKDADILVVNGDFLDMYAVSSFPKEKMILLRKEYEIAQEYVSMFSKKFENIILIKGNHEYRLTKYMNKNISADVAFLFNNDILDRLANGEVYGDDGKVIEYLPTDNVYYDGNEPWFCKVGKAVFAHPNKYSIVEARTAVSTQTYFSERDDTDVVICGHTHSQAFVPTRGKLCIEQGCLCCPLDYTKKGKLTKPQTLGYTVIYQDEEGNCNFNKSHNVYLGTEYPKKQSFDDFLDKIDRKED